MCVSMPVTCSPSLFSLAHTTPRTAVIVLFLGSNSIFDHYFCDNGTRLVCFGAFIASSFHAHPSIVPDCIRLGHRAGGRVLLVCVPRDFTAHRCRRLNPAFETLATFTLDDRMVPPAQHFGCTSGRLLSNILPKAVAPRDTVIHALASSVIPPGIYLYAGIEGMRFAPVELRLHICLSGKRGIVHSVTLTQHIASTEGRS